MQNQIRHDLPIIRKPDTAADMPTALAPYYLGRKLFHNEPPTKRHVHVGLEIGIVLSGKATLPFDTQTLTLSENDCYFIDCMTPHWCGGPKSGDMELLYIHVKSEPIFSIPFFQKSARLLMLYLRLKDIRNPLLAARHDIREFAQRGLRAWQQDNSPHARAHAWAAIVDILALLSEHITPIVSPQMENAQAGAINALLAATGFIDEHYREALSLEEIARACALSTSHLGHMFKKMLDCSPIEYRNRLRIEDAMKKLAATDEKVEAIALECGFETLSLFNRLFKKIAGLSPGQFRASAA